MSRNTLAGDVPSPCMVIRQCTPHYIERGRRATSGCLTLRAPPRICVDPKINDTLQIVMLTLTFIGSILLGKMEVYPTVDRIAFDPVEESGIARTLFWHCSVGDVLGVGRVVPCITEEL